MPVFDGYCSQSSKAYKSYLETGVRGFIKICLSEYRSKMYNIPVGTFTTYKSIIDFVHEYEPARGIKLTVSSLSKLKNRNTISRAVPRLEENEAFISFVKTKIVDFDDVLFFKEYSGERKKELKELKEISKSKS